MATFLLTYNPDKWLWPEEEYRRDIEATSAGRVVEGRWSVGVRKKGIGPGDRAFLLQQRRDRGVVASGWFASEIEEDEHWDGSGSTTTYANVEWDAVVPPEDRLPIELLKQRVPSVTWDRVQGSGVRLTSPADRTVEELWAANLGVPFHSPEEASGSYSEGAVTRVEVNRYERDRAARATCIARWGTTCAVCKMDFEKVYGTLGRGFIHVHHLRELAAIKKTYRVNPVKDLRPVCANCHAMLHRRSPALSIEELQEVIRPAATG